MRDELGIDESFEKIVINALTEAGITKASDPCFLQAFEMTSIHELNK